MTNLAKNRFFLVILPGKPYFGRYETHFTGSSLIDLSHPRIC